MKPRLLCLLLWGCAPVEINQKPGATPGNDDDTGLGAGPDSGDSGAGDPAFEDRMDIDRLLGHLDALQAIADGQGGTRLAGGEGYRLSADYVQQQLEGAGFVVEVQPFSWSGWRENGRPAVETTEGSHWDWGDDILTLTGSAAGDVTGPLALIDPTLPPGPDNSSTSGCEAGDFSEMPAGAIALIQRGGCTFATKVALAEAAGAGAVLIFNEGQTGRQGVVEGTLDSASYPGIPAVGASFALGETLAAALALGPVEARIFVDAETSTTEAVNLWADLPGDSDQLVVVGGHLDSVAAGAGINDNGSGVALVLELALQIKDQGIAPSNSLRFAFWGAEEAGLIGSFHYVATLEEAELNRHLANLNFDMVASPNGGRFVYDGDGSADLGGSPAPVGSDLIEDLLTGWLDAGDLSWKNTAFDGRSDYGPFIWAGIPAGGLFSGAEGRLTGAEATAWGGEAGQPYDACYHAPCDSSDNIDPVIFLELARAAAHATWALAAIDSLGTPGPTPLAPGLRPLAGLHADLPPDAERACHPATTR
jgi:Zn-dependent M28 family amino/carboxypeptidase